MVMSVTVSTSPLGEVEVRIWVRVLEWGMEELVKVKVGEGVAEVKVVWGVVVVRLDMVRFCW